VTDPDKTKVLFRKCRDGGDIVAVFPRELGDGNPDNCLCYQHIGQHGSCEVAWVNKHTLPAEPAEYADLFNELTNCCGYDLVVMKNLNRKDYEHRLMLVRSLDRVVKSMTGGDR
jgi:hypothetical protein